MNEYEEMGKRWLRGEITIDDFQGIKLNDKQKGHLEAKDRFNLIYGGMASGKTLGWQVKLVLFSQWFPGTRMLIGRRTRSNARSTFMADFVDICPPGLYEEKVGEGKLIFSNGSQAIFFGLDALQSGSGDDLKKAVQELKSHNFGFIFIDQLEEIEFKVFEALNSRMRRRQCKHGTIEGTDVKVMRDEAGLALYDICLKCDKYSFNQMNLVTNPANFWAYDYFVANPRPMTKALQTSMLDNRANLSEQFVESELAKKPWYVERYVKGTWDPSAEVEGRVFESDYIQQQKLFSKSPLREFNGIKIYEEACPHTYQIGIDPSEGAVDPCYISVVDIITGEQVASFSGFVPLLTVAERAYQLSMIYNLVKQPMVVCEVQGGGQAVIAELQNKGHTRFSERNVTVQRDRFRKENKIGFHTNYASKKQLIEHTRDLLRKGFIKIRDAKVIEELMTFVYSDEVRRKGAGAQRGYHDDRVMGMMFAYHGIEAKDMKQQNLLSREILGKKKKVKVKYQYV